MAELDRTKLQRHKIVFRAITLVVIAFSVIGLFIVQRDFGTNPAIVASLFLLAPLYYGLKMGISRRDLVRNELLYFFILLFVTISAFVITVKDWYEEGIQNLVARNRKFQDFQAIIKSDPAFHNVTLETSNLGTIFPTAKIRSELTGSVESAQILQHLHSLARQYDVVNPSNIRVHVLSDSNESVTGPAGQR